MKFAYILLAGLLLLVGCAPYKQLKPEPPLSPIEQGYTELIKKDKNFELKKDKKYFISFPGPPEKNFYLVLDISNKNKMSSFFTAELLKKKTPGKKIKDETLKPEQLSVYAIHASTAMYYWLIDSVPEDLVLSLKYRYVPQWRFKFENHHAAFKSTLQNNLVDRTEYTTLGTTFHFSGFDFQNAITTTDKHLKEIKKVYDELLAIESIFPPSILNSSDKAYQNYVKLKNEVEGEVFFQSNYLDVLDFFEKENKTKGRVPAFLGFLEDFITYFSQKSRFPPNVVQESQKVIKNRLDGIPPFYNGELSKKSDWKPIDPEKYYLKPLHTVGELYKTAGLATSQDYTALTTFVHDFNQKGKDFSSASVKIEQVKKSERDLSQMPGNEFYRDIVVQVSKIQGGMPQAMGQSYAFYKNFKCTNSLNAGIEETNNELKQMLAQYRKAEALVPRLNAFRAQEAYRQMISLLRQNRHLGFLVDKYTSLDKMSIEKQTKDIKSSLAGYRWRTAEAELNTLHRDNTFLDASKILQAKQSTVLDLEDGLYSSIDKISRRKILKFVEEKVHVLRNVDSLYADSVFMPAYTVRFSSGSQRHLIQRRNELIGHLAKMKENEFPAKAITLMYQEFLKNPKDNGVLKARAVVAHGKHYKGNDKKVKIRIAECDPFSAKRVRKVKDYRRVFALPITDREKGTNRYFFRLNLDVPSKAKFPVWDVNIKLPKAIAKNAASEQWYEKMKLNNKLLKNEGRFTISAPTAENNYECQISPVQTKKGKRNIVDVFFKHKSFKVFPISVMVQKPIIKKN